jgi:hypothetical protein
VAFFAFIATYLSFLSGLEINVYQLFRGLGPALLSLLILGYLSLPNIREKVYANRIYKTSLDGLINFFTVVAVLRITDAFLGLRLMPGIYVGDYSRVFPPLSSLLVPVAIISWIHGRKACFIACLALLVSFQSKSNFAVLCLSLLVILLSETRLKKGEGLSLIITRKALTLIVVVFISCMLVFHVFGNRYLDFIAEGDQARLVATQLAVSSVKSLGQLLFGIGHGVAHGEGYYQYVASLTGASPSFNSDSAMESLIVNSRYDIESLAPYLLVRHGLLGSVAIFAAITVSIKSNLGRILLFAYLAINGLGGSILNTVTAPVIFALYSYIDFYCQLAINNADQFRGPSPSAQLLHPLP